VENEKPTAIRFAKKKARALARAFKMIQTKGLVSFSFHFIF
jgi:hypothetical protein